MSSKSHTFWRADKETSRKIIELMQLHSEFTKAGCKLARRFKGADRNNIYYSQGAFGRRRLAGLRFKNTADVDQKLFCRSQNTADGWRPRRGPTKAAKELAAEFDAITDESMPKILELLGLDWFFGFSTCTPGIHVVKNVVYLEVGGDSKKKPKGCQRISDLDYERLTGAGPTLQRNRT